MMTELLERKLYKYCFSSNLLKLKWESLWNFWWFYLKAVILPQSLWNLKWFYLKAVPGTWQPTITHLSESLPADCRKTPIFRPFKDVDFPLVAGCLWSVALMCLCAFSAFASYPTLPRPLAKWKHSWLEQDQHIWVISKPHMLHMALLWSKRT